MAAVGAALRSAKDTLDELLDTFSPEELEQFDDDLLAIEPRDAAEPVPGDWRKRIPLVFPRAAAKPFAPHHERVWDWANGIELDSAPRPMCAFFARGGGKSSSAELVVTDLGCRGKRRYGWYVRMTQTKADESVTNIALRLESPEIGRYYPDHARRSLGKFGNSRGWRRNRVWTAGGLIIDALGLDTASRGSKAEDQRPDFIIFDDVDDLHDGPAQTQKKIDIITKSILPAGANNCAVLFIQNIIIPDGIAAQLADGRADFLADRIVVGPIPAVIGLKTEWRVDRATGIRAAIITAGKATWEGQDLATCQRNILSWGYAAFIKEAQHKVDGRAEGVVLRFDAARHLVDLLDEEVVRLAQRGRMFAGIDFGLWRFGFTLWAMTPLGYKPAKSGQPIAGKVIELDELFSQKEGLGVRARRIHELVVATSDIEDPSPKDCPIWGDQANPQDILEMNLAFKAGWDDPETGKRVTSRLRVMPVASENKARVNAAERINKALDEGELLYRRGIGAGETWRLGWNAGAEGTEQTGSRLLWEIDNWAVPVPKAGHAQEQNPDDDTADGSDMIASMRYALMSHWKPVPESTDDEHVPDDKGREFDVKKRAFKEPRHAADDLFHTPTQRRPAVRTQRPRVRG